MIEPKEVILKSQTGEERTFLISKFPAVAGREIIAKYPVANMPKLGDYKVSEETMLKAMAYAARVHADGAPPTPLTTLALVNNHVTDWEMLAKLEFALMEYNVSFFRGGLNSDFLESISQKAVALISKTWITLSERSSQAEKPPSTSSKRSTR